MAKSPPFPIPDADPQRKRTTWETIVITTPVILTVMATVLAGLSSGELSSAQYFRSIAAQMQSKVSDQWGYFQAKKLRSEQCGNTVQILQNIAAPATSFIAQDLAATGNRLVVQMKQVSADSKELTARANQMESLVAQLNQSTTQPDIATALENFGNGKAPDIQEESISDPQILDVIQALDKNASEADLERMAGQIDQAKLDQAFTVANDNTVAFEKALAHQTDVNGKIAQLLQKITSEAAAYEKAAQQSPAAVPSSAIAGIHEQTAQLNSALAIARLRSSAARYDREARYNQVLAQLYEIQVRRQGYISERHRERSKEFFYGMLGAQAGVTIATFSLAVRRRNLLWGLAASAGLAAVTFAAYVYMFV